MIGKTLGNFDVSSSLGRGGMGEVYRAKDRKLGRDVAIKVLPKRFTENPDYVERFYKEGRAAAKLNKGGAHVAISGEESCRQQGQKWVAGGLCSLIFATKPERDTFCGSGSARLMLRGAS